MRQTPFLVLAAIVLATEIGCTNPGFMPWKTDSLTTPAENQSTDSRELPPKDAARACMVAAEEMEKGGHPEQAVALYEKARRNDPSLKTIAHHLAVLYDAQGDSSRSLAEYKLATEEEPKNADVFSDLGYYYFKRDNLNDAERQLRKALEIDPKHQKALTNLGMVLRPNSVSTKASRRLLRRWGRPRPIRMSAY